MAEGDFQFVDLVAVLIVLARNTLVQVVQLKKAAELVVLLELGNQLIS